jgi:hypothetical protein
MLAVVLVMYGLVLQGQQAQELRVLVVVVQATGLCLVALVELVLQTQAVVAVLMDMAVLA